MYVLYKIGNSVLPPAVDFFHLPQLHLVGFRERGLAWFFVFFFVLAYSAMLFYRTNQASALRGAIKGSRLGGSIWNTQSASPSPFALGIHHTRKTQRRWETTSAKPELKAVSTESPLLSQDVSTMTYPQKFVRSLPVSWIPYAELMRLDKPIGTLLLYSSCTWSITMAAYATSAPLSHTLGTLGLFGLGSVIMRGAGCTINDILDRKYDSQVERTVTRPLARKAVSVPQAITFLGAQCFAGLGILLSLPLDCFWVGALSVPVFMTYPLFKRFTYYPQFYFALSFSFGVLLGFTSMGVWNWPAMLSLQASTILWGVTYDTIYAHQDKKFDVTAGVKSTALKWGNNSKSIMRALTVGQIGLLTTAGVFGAMGPFFYAATGIAAYRIFNMIKKVDLDDPADCWKWFLNNINTSHVLWAGCFADYLARITGFF